MICMLYIYFLFGIGQAHHGQAGLCSGSDIHQAWTSHQ